MLIVTPLRAKGSSLGLMSFYSQERLEFTPDEITLLMTIADQVGSSVERARLIHKAEQAAVIEERQRLARELHDSVTQLIYGQVLFAGASLKVMQQGNQTLLQQHLARLDQAAQQALREMRLLVYELRPSDHLEEGLVNALRRRLEAVERRTGMNAQLSVIGEISLDEATEMALYRIAQEALNNTLKHSAASAVEVSLVTSEKGFRLEIADNGSGFDYPEKLTAGGMGLGSMQDRIEALHGTLEVITSPGNGTRVIAAFEEVK
jgi:signal transduction histidine kinase